MLSNVEIEKCLLQVSQAFTDIESQSEDIQIQNISTICQLHDSVIQTLSLRVGDSIAQTHRDMLKLRVNDMDDEVIHRIKSHIPLEADLYRAAKLTSLYLLQKLPLASYTSESIVDSLRLCYQKSQILLDILQRIYIQCFLSSERNLGEDLTIPSNYQFLELYIQKLQPVALEHYNTESIISFDRESLQREEDELLQMASTPTPFENKQQYLQNDQTSNYNSRLFARLILGDSMTDLTSRSSLSVLLDDKGVLRVRDASSEEYKDSWWIITSESSISFESPLFTITSVIKNDFSTTSVTLNVGRDGAVWWEKVSKTIVELQEIKYLQEEIQTLWKTEEFQAAVKLARKEVSRHATVLN